MCKRLMTMRWLCPLQKYRFAPGTMLGHTPCFQPNGEMMEKPATSDALISEAIAMAWADDVSFDKIRQKLGLTESDTIKLMRTHLKPSSFKLWRKRVSGRKTKHAKLLRPKESRGI